MFGLTGDEYTALILSGLFCSFVYITGQYLKKLTILLFDNESTSEADLDDSSRLHKCIYIALHDGIAAFQACACSLENAVVRITLGYMSLLAAIEIHGLLMLRYAWGDAHGSTCDVFYRYLMRRTDLRGVCLSWVFQLVGAFCALHLSYFWWGLRLSSPHDRLQTYREHVLRRSLRGDRDGFQNLGDLQVPVLLGIFVESGVAFIDILMAGVVPALLSLWKRLQQRWHQRLRSGEGDFWMAEFVFFSLRQATGIYLVYLGLPLTGAYMNGVNAVIQTWGLGRASNPLYHIIVYWFSPLVGVWSGVKSLEVLRNTFVSFSCLFSFFEPTVTVSASEVLNESAADLPQEDVDLDLPNSLGPKSLSEEHFDRLDVCGSSMNYPLEPQWNSEYSLIIPTAANGRFDDGERFGDSSRSSPGRNEKELDVDGELNHRRHRSRNESKSLQSQNR